MKNKKIIYCLGCLGFIGQHVTRLLLKKGHYIRGIDKVTYAANIDLLDEFNKYENFTFEKIDICDMKWLYDCDYIINMAAETHVDNSIVQSDDFIHSNVNGVHNILELIRKNNQFKMPTLIHFSCYDEDTKALTKNGLKTYDKLKIGDEVLSVNPNNKQIEFKKILKIIIQDYDGEMIHFKHKSDNLMVTPNHRMYYNKNNMLHIDEAQNICNNSGQCYVRGLKNGIIDDNIYLDKIGNVSVKDLFYVSGVFIGDGFNAHQISKRKNKTGLNRKDFLKTCRDKNGRFIKTGYIGENTHALCNSYRIFFDVPENDKARKELEMSLTNLGIKWYSEKNKSGEHVYFSSKEWVEYFKQFGKYAEHKTIPDWMFDYDHTILRKLYEGIIDSDGYWNKSGTGILTTISYDLVQKCCLLGTCLGFHMKFKSYKQPDNLPFFGERQVKTREKSYQVFFNTKNIMVGNKKYNKINYKGKIWCVTVEDNKNLIIERNGLLKISGNTDETYGDIVSGSHKETDLLRPSNPYSATKASADMLIKAWERTYNVPAIIVRPTNNYGMGQYVEKLIPKTCKFLSIGRKIPMHEKGEPIRNWLHAKDTARAIEIILEKGEIGEIYNISGNFEQKNIVTFKKILDTYFKDMNVSINDYADLSITRKGQDVRYAIDDSKIKKLGWKPTCNFDEELPKIVNYYKNKFIW